MWMSDASRSIPAAMMRLTSRIASSPTVRAVAESRSCSAMVSNWKESGLIFAAVAVRILPESSSLSRTSALLKSSSPIATGAISTVCSVRFSSASAALSRGLTMPTVSTLPVSFTGSSRKLRTSLVGTIDKTDGERSKSRISA